MTGSVMTGNVMNSTAMNNCEKDLRFITEMLPEFQRSSFYLHVHHVNNLFITLKIGNLHPKCKGPFQTRVATKLSEGLITPLHTITSTIPDVQIF